MKEVKSFIVANIIILLLKVLAAVVCSSTVLLMTGLYDLLLIISSILVYKKKDNKKYKAVFTSLLGLLFVMMAVGIIFSSFIFDVRKTSLWIFLFIFIFVIVRYIVGCFYTNKNYASRKGILAYGNMISNTDFYMYGLAILSLILIKCSKWLEILKYADRALTIGLSLFVFCKAIKLIVNSFKVLEGKEKFVDEDYIKEISDRSEVKRVDNLSIQSFGGIRCGVLKINLNNGISMIDINTFMITLQDYLLKISDVCMVVMSENKISNAYKKVSANARNSRSGNGKTNTKKKNTKKKNKKH